MNIPDLVRFRLHQQQLVRQRFSDPCRVVAWFGAIQAQDYTAAKWAIGQRLKDAGDSAIEEAFNSGLLLRTHVMRPTWHFVTPADIRWMLALTAPRIKAAMSYYLRAHGLDARIVGRGQAAIANALRGGKHLTRAELLAAVQRAGLLTAAPAGAGGALGHILISAELDAIVCSGPRRGRQFTYALLEERVPPAPILDRDEALAELSRRYFISHGPATLRDFAWWSGLTLADARAGVESIRRVLRRQEIAGQTYWLSRSAPSTRAASPSASLLPNYDEYIVGYADRSAATDNGLAPGDGPRSNMLFNHTIVIEGAVVGVWKRTYRETTVDVELAPFARLSARENQMIAAALERFGTFAGQPVRLQKIAGRR